MSKQRKQQLSWAGGLTATMPLVCASCGLETMAVYTLATHEKLAGEVAEGRMTCGQCEEKGVLRRTGVKGLIIAATPEDIARIR
jgi:hypothetical protein